MSCKQNTTPNHVDCALHKKPGAIHMAYRGLVASLLGMFVMACSGCGGGGGSASTPNQQVAPAPASPSATQATKTTYSTLWIQMEGDSTMYGLTQDANGTYYRTSLNAPADLLTDFQPQYGSRVQIVNDGIPGSGVVGRVTGTGAYTVPWSVAVKDPGVGPVVVANWGINDAAAYSPAAFQQYLLEFIQISQQAGKTVVLEEPNPVCDSADHVAKLDQIVAVIDSVAAQQGLALIPQYQFIQTIPNWQSYLKDCLHPNEDLYATKAQREHIILAPIVAQMLAN